MIRTIVAAILIYYAVVLTAGGHSWYPRDCCHDQDCAPLDPARVRVMPWGYLIDGVHQVAHANAKWSPDEHYHGCFPKGHAAPVLRCFWAPQRSM